MPLNNTTICKLQKIMYELRIPNETFKGYDKLIERIGKEVNSEQEFYNKYFDVIFSTSQFQYTNILDTTLRFCKEYNFTFDSDCTIKLIKLFKIKMRRDMFMLEDPQKLNDYIPYLTINYEILKLIIEICSENITLQNKIIELNLFNDEIINLIISKHCSNTYKKLVELEKIKIIDKHLDIACEYLNLDLIKFIIDKKFIPTNKHFMLLFEHEETDRIDEIIELLVSCGVEITLDNIKELAKQSIEVKNIDKYGIKVDDELVKICMEHSFSPAYLATKELSTDELHSLFSKYDKLSSIKKIIGKQKVKYDVECLRNACKIRINRGIISFLIKHGVKPDLICLENIINARHDQSIKIVYDALKPTLKK